MLKKHGKRQIEYSRYFTIPKKSKQQEYIIDMWFFIPSSLNIKQFKKNDFFKNFNSYTRYNAPDIPLGTLIDFTNPLNPLTRLKNLKHSTENYQEIEYELKTLLNTFKMSCKKMFITLIGMKEFSKIQAERNIEVQLVRFKSVLFKLEELSEKAPKNYSIIYNLALEGLSLRIEKSLYELYRMFPKSKNLIINEINSQRELRLKLGFESIITDNEENNSKTIYREHIIKKWSESIMYINMEDSKAQKGINHIFLGSAAALSMLITGAITLIVAKIWGNDNLYWFIAALVLYSLKDRIKDIFKALFVKKMNKIFSDRVLGITSPISKRKVGKSYERVTFPVFKELKKSVQQLRFTEKEDIPIKQFQEDIMHYRKYVKIKTPKLYKNHSRLFGIKEIFRFDFRRWFHKMDKDIEKCYMPFNGNLKQVNGERLYHFNVIIETKDSEKTSLKKYKISANSKMIKTIKGINI